MKCQLRQGERTCDKLFVKATGIFTLGKYFCKEKCIDEDDDIKTFNKMEEESARMAAEAEAMQDLSSEGEIDL